MIESVSAPPDPHVDAIPVSARLVTDPQFQQWRDEFLRFTSGARTAQSDPEALLDIQVDMASLLLNAQELQRELEVPADTEHATMAKVCQRLQLITRQIADGIAWRALQYDRAVIRLLASKPQTGHMELRSAITEVAMASRHAERTGDLVVLNDLTNFLRYGDLLSVGQNGIAIHEVKESKGAARSGRASRQKKRLKRLLQFVTTGERVSEIEGLQERIFTLPSKPRAHISAIARLISEARERGQASARISSSVAVQVFHIPDLAEGLANGRIRKGIIRDPFSESPNSHSLDSLGLFRFSPNVAPYSVFPLTPTDCVDVMTGAIWIVGYVSSARLVRTLRRRSLWGRLATDADRRLAPDGNVVLAVARGRERGALLVPWAVLARLAYEFVDEESVADEIEEELAAIEELGHTVLFHSRFLGEPQLWD